MALDASSTSSSSGEGGARTKVTSGEEKGLDDAAELRLKKKGILLKKNTIVGKVGHSTHPAASLVSTSSTTSMADLPPQRRLCLFGAEASWVLELHRRLICKGKNDKFDYISV